MRDFPIRTTPEAISPPAKRQLAEQAGRNAEARAASWYEAAGFATLARRLRTARGEIDLVVADQTTIAFVEVKARRHARHAAEAVTPRQQVRLAGAAEIILAEHPDWQRNDTRFDVVLIVGAAITIIQDAFRPGEGAQ